MLSNKVQRRLDSSGTFGGWTVVGQDLLTGVEMRPKGVRGPKGQEWLGGYLNTIVTTLLVTVCLSSIRFVSTS